MTERARRGFLAAMPGPVAVEDEDEDEAILDVAAPEGFADAYLAYRSAWSSGPDIVQKVAAERALAEAAADLDAAHSHGA